MAVKNKSYSLIREAKRLQKERDGVNIKLAELDQGGMRKFWENKLQSIDRQLSDNLAKQRAR